MSAEDSRNVKKSILMRYPLSFLEEVSRALIGYKSWRDNKEMYMALPIMDTLIDLVTLDEKTRKRWWELNDGDIDKTHTIQIPQDLVTDFRAIFHGPRKDGELALKYLSPGTSVDLQKGRVVIRKPVNFMRAWGAYDPAYIILIGGFYTKQIFYQPTPFGMMPTEQIVPTIDMQDPDLKYHDCDTIPIAVWFKWYDAGLWEISPVATMIEKHIAKVLEDAGYNMEKQGDSAADEPKDRGFLEKMRRLKP